MERPGADLIAYYLSRDRLPAQEQYFRKNAHTKRRLCERFAAPVVGAVTCQDIKTAHMQQIVNCAPTPGEGKRVQGMISPLAGAGIAGGGGLANARLKEVHWQAGERPLPAPEVSGAGESPLFVDPAEIPAGADIARLGQARAAGRHGGRAQAWLEAQRTSMIAAIQLSHVSQQTGNYQAAITHAEHAAGDLPVTARRAGRSRSA